MNISFRELITALHGMGFGALFLLAFSGALFELYRLCTPGKSSAISNSEERWLRGYLLVMVFLAWSSVLSGAYIVYPWYRAHAPAGTTDFTEYARQKLLADPATAGWHNLGMEWKEHVAWFAPIAITMVAYVFMKYGSDLANHREVRKAVFAFGLAAFVTAAIAGLFGAMINKNAPVQGGGTITLIGGTK